MQIFVKMPMGRTLCLDAGLEDSVEVVKAKIARKAGVPCDEDHRLVYGVKQLQEGFRLRDYGVTVNATLDLLMSLRGGAGRCRLVQQFAEACKRRYCSSAPSLLGYYHQPVALNRELTLPDGPDRKLFKHAPRFYSLSRSREEPANLPALASGHDIVDCDRGLLVLQQPAASLRGEPLRIMVFDPVTSQCRQLPPLPEEATKIQSTYSFVKDDISYDEEFLGATVLGRVEGEFKFHILYLSTKAFQVPRAEAVPWVYSSEDHDRGWFRVDTAPKNPYPLFPQSTLTIGSKSAVHLDRYPVHLRGKACWYCHWSKIGFLLEADVDGFDGQCLPFGRRGIPHGFKAGEKEGQAFIAGLYMPDRKEVLRLGTHVQGKGYQWEDIPVGEIFDQKWYLERRSPKHTVLTDIDRGNPDQILFKTSGNGSCTFNLRTFQVGRLVTPDGLQWGHPVFPFFA